MTSITKIAASLGTVAAMGGASAGIAVPLSTRNSVTSKVIQTFNRQVTIENHPETITNTKKEGNCLRVSIPTSNNSQSSTTEGVCSRMPEEQIKALNIQNK